jgi:hypothetical protein
VDENTLKFSRRTSARSRLIEADLLLDKGPKQREEAAAAAKARILTLQVDYPQEPTL